ncbi:MAG TPA: hypothetical protein VGR86_09925 [Steroidobacteraceae bacterium]|nr:hypothetical protein [Steroidobacteraceae bacterium]
MSAPRPDTAGKTRICPHCKATILESLTICPGCLHHLRFDQQAAKRQVAANSALRVEGVITHPTAATEPWEYFVVIAVRNERGEEVARQVVNVGVLRNAEKRTFALSVEVLPQQALVVPNKPVAAQPPAPAPRAPAPRAPPLRPPASPAAKPSPAAAPAGAAAKPLPGATAPPKR